MITEQVDEDEFCNFYTSAAESSRVMFTGWSSPSPDMNLLASDLVASDFYNHWWIP